MIYEIYIYLLFQKFTIIEYIVHLDEHNFLFTIKCENIYIYT